MGYYLIITMNVCCNHITQCHHLIVCYCDKFFFCSDIIFPMKKFHRKHNRNANPEMRPPLLLPYTSCPEFRGSPQLKRGCLDVYTRKPNDPPKLKEMTTSQLWTTLVSQVSFYHCSYSTLARRYY